jgi:lipopolysaccharide biosynthesis regulator YciM
MLQKGMTKVEIENFLKGKGEFVQLSHLEIFLRKDPPLETKKFIYLKMAEIYDKKNMFTEAAKMFHSMAIISVAFTDKIKYHVKEAEMFIKAGMFNRVDEAVRKSMNDANATEKSEIFITIKNFYKKQAEQYTKELRRNHSIKIYEKLLEMNISETERSEIKEKLLKLYEKTGKLREYYSLKGER